MVYEAPPPYPTPTEWTKLVKAAEQHGCPTCRRKPKRGRTCPGCGGTGRAWTWMHRTMKNN